MKADLLLIQRDNCHLCELAWELLAQAKVSDFESVWIDGNAALERRYGVRVPVLLHQSSGRELDWPFSAEQIRAFLV
jgi:Glutaredoxin-like domain (DUF836)